MHGIGDRHGYGKVELPPRPESGGSSGVVAAAVVDDVDTLAGPSLD